MICVIYNRPEDLVYRSLTESSISRSNKVVCLSEAELVDTLAIDDQVIDGVPQISWKGSNGIEVTNEKTLLVSRLHYLNKERFIDFHEDDREYAFSETYAYFSFAITAFKHRTATPSVHGLGGGPIPLPLQWQWAKAVGLPSPRFYLGPKESCPFIDSESLIEGNVFNPYEWQAGKADLSIQDNPQAFLYLKPSGERFLCLCVRGEMIIKSVDPSISPSPAAERMIRQVAGEMTKKSDMQINEQLYYVEGETVTFAMIDNQISSQWDTPEAKGFLRDQLLQWSQSL